MTWVLPEILLPLLIALGLGVLIGWLLWRWRRRTIHASEWNQLTTNANQAQADVAAIRAAYEEAINERSMVVSQLGEANEQLDAANVRASESAELAEGLTADLEISRNELSLATEHRDALETELSAVSATAADRDQLDDEIVRLREELETGAVRRSQLERDVEERDGELERALNDVNQLTTRAESLDDELQAKSLELTALLESTSEQSTRLEDLEEGAAAAALVTHRVDDAEARAAELDAALTAARTELDVSQGRIADYDARLSTTAADLDAAHARVSELEAKAHDDETGGAELIGQLRVELTERDRRISALEAAAAEPADDGHAPQHALRDEHTPDHVEVANADAAAVIGISVADHVDDLKVIRGIGPRMEELLITLGITSWEQLAELDETGIARVDDALQEFPGRIERDRWVDQARELVERFPDVQNRPTRETFLNRSRDEDSFT